MKRVRMLLRVSSNQQLEADGDLTVQRRLVKEYVEQQRDWQLDKKEYFEGGVSGYKNFSGDRDILQEILQDAGKRKFDILVVYKDDRLGRQLWDTGMYVMALKNYGVDVYSVKDGRISPDTDDPMAQIILAMRYGMAQKSSADTGMRVKDTAQKLVQKGKFMGGTAPYGYQLELTGELSKHGRALHKLCIVEEKADVVRHIYDLSLNREYGSAKIARVLNEDSYYCKMAPGEYWRAGTITSILTNPVYCGYVAYKRREKMNGKYRKLDSKEWIKAEKQNPSIVIVDEDCWEKVQVARHRRNKRYTRSLNEQEKQEITSISRNARGLPLIDVLYCGYCGCKLTNGTRYNYWTIKETGEKRTGRYPAYKCQNAWSGIPHVKVRTFPAEKIEAIVFECIGEYINTIKNPDEIMDTIMENSDKKRRELEREYKKNCEEWKNIQKNIDMLEEHIPEAMAGEYSLTLEELTGLIRKQKEKADGVLEKNSVLRKQMERFGVDERAWKEIKRKVPSWKQIFLQSDTDTKRVLVGKLIERIDVTVGEIRIRFRINLNDFLSIESGGEITEKVSRLKRSGL